LDVKHVAYYWRISGQNPYKFSLVFEMVGSALGGSDNVMTYDLEGPDISRILGSPGRSLLLKLSILLQRFGIVRHNMGELVSGWKYYAN